MRFPLWIDGLARWQLAALMLIVDLGSRAVARISGLRFDATALDWGWQQLDTRLLKERLFESLFYLHAQPPLFNLFLGLVLKAAGAWSLSAFEVLFVAMG